MREVVEEHDELTFLKEDKEQEKTGKSHKDITFRYYYILDFFTLELACFCFTLFMYGLKEFYGQDTLEKIFHRYFFFCIPIIFGLILIVMLLCYFLFRRIILWGRGWLIYSLYYLFVFLMVVLICFCSMSSVITAICFEGMINFNILAFILMNSIRPLEDKKLIKLCIIYVFTFTYIIIYIATINIRYITFFILGTSSVLYFSYCELHHKRLIIINFPHAVSIKKREIKIIEDEEKDLSVSYYRKTSLDIHDAININNNMTIKPPAEDDGYDYTEITILNSYAPSTLSKICFLASFVDTTVYNFS